MNNMSENDIVIFKKWLKEHLAFGKVTITFTKKDGTERVMECTTNPELIPSDPVVESTEPKTVRKVNEDVCPVYEIESKSWKSFRWDSVKAVGFNLGEESETKVFT